MKYKDNVVACNTVFTIIVMIALLILIFFVCCSTYVDVYKVSKTQDEMYREIQNLKYSDYNDVLKEINAGGLYNGR